MKADGKKKQLLVRKKSKKECDSIEVLETKNKEASHSLMTSKEKQSIVSFQVRAEKKSVSKASIG